MKNKILIIIVIIVMAVGAVYNVATGVAGVTNSRRTELSVNAEKGAVCEVQAIYAVEAYHIEHKINGFIPLGTENFFLVGTLDGEIAPLLVKESKSWFKSNFGESGMAYKPVEIKGEVSRFKEKTKLGEIKSALASEFGTELSDVLYIDARYSFKYTLRLISGLLLIIGGILLFIALTRHEFIAEVKWKLLGGGALTALLIGVVLFLLGLTVFR